LPEAQAEINRHRQRPMSVVTRKVRLPDAIIWATALHESALLVTRDTKDFPSAEPGIRIPY
jgi:predicted nucleic acid-binding protein